MPSPITSSSGDQTLPLLWTYYWESNLQATYFWAWWGYPTQALHVVRIWNSLLGIPGFIRETKGRGGYVRIRKGVGLITEFVEMFIVEEEPQKKKRKAVSVDASHKRPKKVHKRLSLGPGKQSKSHKLSQGLCWIFITGFVLFSSCLMVSDDMML